MKEQVVTFSKFRTINVMKDIFKLAPDELAMAVNVDLTDDGKIVQRAGTVKVGEFNGKCYLFKWNEIREGQVYERLLAVSGNSIYIFDDGTGQFLLITNTLTSSDRWGGIGYVDKFIFANGTKIYKLQWGTGGYTVEDISSIQYIPKGTLFAVYNNMLVIAGEGTENVYFSNIGDPLTWDVYNFVAMSGIVTAVYTAAEFLFIGTDKALYKVVKTGDVNIPFKIETIINAGIIGITEFTGGSVCIMTDDKRIAVFSPYAQSGEQVNDSIGIVIRDILPTEVSFFGSGIDNRIFISNDDYTFVLSPYTAGFSVYGDGVTLTKKIISSVIYKGQQFYSNKGGKVFRYDKTIFTDAGVDFDTYIDTAVIGGDSLEIMKNFRQMYLVSNSSTKTTLSLYVAVNCAGVFRDFGSDYVYGSESRLGFAFLGNFVLGGSYAQRSKYRIDVNSNAIQVRIKRVSANSDMKISDIGIHYYTSFRN